jgi:hypothetical protein
MATKAGHINTKILIENNFEAPYYFHDTKHTMYTLINE